MTSNGRVARLTALALATGTPVAAGASSAGAANVATPILLSGATSGNVLQLEINLPAALPEIPGVGRHIVQSISLSNGNVVNGSAVNVLSHAALGKGTITDLVTKNLPLDLFPEATSSLSSPNSVSKGIDLSNPAAGLTLKVLPTTSMVANPNLAQGVLSQSHTALDQIKLDVPGLGAALPTALTTVTNTLNTVVGTVAAPTGQVTDAVNSALNTLQSTPVGAALPAATVDSITTTLTNTLTGLQNLPNALGAVDTSLINIKQLTSDQAVNRVGGLVSSSSNNALTNISLVGGLITVDALKSGVTASVDTVAHKANVAYLPENNQIVRVHVAGVLDLVLDATGIHLDNLPGGLPAGTVTDTVNTAVNALLSTAGLLGIKAYSGANSAPVYAADGSGAAGKASGAGLIINPVGLGTDAAPFVKISFVNSEASVSAKAIAAPVQVTPVQAAKQSLPRTGANLPMTGAIATGLVGLAFAARRRRSAHVAG